MRGRVLIAACAAAAGLAWPPRADTPSVGGDSREASAPPIGDAARGAYLARAADCVGCHTRPGAEPFAGGLIMRTPLGPIVTTNITPDPAFGIGRYTLRQFDDAVRRGRAPDHRNLYPAMPYASLTGLGDDDVRDLYAYLMTAVAPVARATAPTTLPFPFDQRWALTFWRWAFFRERRFVPDPHRDPQWNRGAYLVRVAGHCGACHTPRGIGYQERASDESDPRFLTGEMTEDWFASNLRGDEGTGLGRLDVEQVAELLGTGRTAGRVASGSMRKTIEDSLAHLTSDDRRAIATYLKSLGAAGRPGAFDPAAAERPGADGLKDAGQVVYEDFCQACHGERGQGGIGPALAANPTVLAAQPMTLVRVIIEGQTPLGDAARSPPMPPFGGRLTDLQIAKLVTFVRDRWGNRAKAVDAAQVRRMRDAVQR